MNFDNIKQKMDADPMTGNPIPTSVTNLVASKMPVNKIRKTMIGEIITQLLCMVIFFAAPFFVKMHTLPKMLYLIFMFITCLITFGYLAKMVWFLNKTSDMNNPGRDTVLNYIFDLKLTLEVYKTAIIAGSILLPVSITCFILGAKIVDEQRFMDLITFNISTVSIILIIIGYLALTVVFYLGTVVWANSLYGNQIKKLEETLAEFEIE